MIKNAARVASGVSGNSENLHHEGHEVGKELSSEKSMILLAGPRQCGKTTFTKMIAAGFSNSIYFNWDIATDKKRLIQQPFFFQKMDKMDLRNGKTGDTSPEG